MFDRVNGSEMPKGVEHTLASPGEAPAAKGEWIWGEKKGQAGFFWWRDEEERFGFVRASLKRG